MDLDKDKSKYLVKKMKATFPDKEYMKIFIRITIMISVRESVRTQLQAMRKIMMLFNR